MARVACAEALVAALSETHPYEVPAVRVLPVVAAAGPYAAWLREETDPTQEAASPLPPPRSPR